MPDVWGTIVLGVNILLLLAGWLLFQQAKSDLTARAAQIPVLSEIKALQKSVAALLEQLKLESIQTSAQLDTRCAEARDLLAAIDKRLHEARPAPVRLIKTREAAPRQRTESEAPPAPRQVEPSPDEDRRTTDDDRRAGEFRREQVYSLADMDVDQGEIARQTGFSEAEVELILGMRAQGS
jgi:hypothetical protein